VSALFCCMVPVGSGTSVGKCACGCDGAARECACVVESSHELKLTILKRRRGLLSWVCLSLPIPPFDCCPWCDAHSDAHLTSPHPTTLLALEGTTCKCAPSTSFSLCSQTTSARLVTNHNHCHAPASATMNTPSVTSRPSSRSQSLPCTRLGYDEHAFTPCTPILALMHLLTTAILTHLRPAKTHPPILCTHTRPSAP
jgi:hypothetical protein